MQCVKWISIMSTNSFLEIIDNALNTLSRRENSLSHERINTVHNRRNFTYRRNNSQDILSILSSQFIEDYIQSNPEPFSVLDDIITIYIDVMSNNNDLVTDLSSITPVVDRDFKRTLTEINTILGPYSKIKSNDELLKKKECCSICQDEYKINQGKRVLVCNHTFHKKCIDKWLVCKSDCPICRTNVFSKTN